ncbi:MAG: hypothetical protein JXD19_12805 [Deltaproteobacteria bacterium]|nr:hypothetical protein [Deltaproteobacteria bacterium]
MSDNNSSNEYEVLSPWAEADPVKLRGICPRLTDLAGKKIGLFCNSKRAAKLMLTAVEKQLKNRFPSTVTSWYEFTLPNVPEIETVNKVKFMEWVKGVDAVVGAVGD